MKGWKDSVAETIYRRVTLAGQVVDAETKEPIIDAEVTIAPAGEPKMSLFRRNTTTTVDGWYFFMDRPLGDYDLEVSVETSNGRRYRSKQATIRVPADQKRSLIGGSADIELEPVSDRSEANKAETKSRTREPSLARGKG